ncbi:ISAs1 family transposase [Bradyrhizobium ivorense]|uniref:ISAs1 family transposase n=1 Tax=Bradyrhizobium ivorense TaxID=2511166 RepID=UPI0030B8C90B
MQASAEPAGRCAGRTLLSLVQIHVAEAAAARHRSHWGIENQLHWVLDVHFTEDSNRARKDNAPENLAILRRLALNILRTHPDSASIRRKIKRAGWDDAFLLSRFSHMR